MTGQHAESSSSVVIKHYLLITVVGALLYFTNLGATRLWDVDEAIFSQAAVEMMERGDWVTPYFNGTMFGHKPPLMYWFQIAAYQLFGTTEFAARFYSAIFGIATMILTYELGRTLFNRRTGLWGAIALGSCINFAVIARAATPDSYLTFFCTLALYILVKATASSASHAGWKPELPPSWKAYLLSYAAMGVAVLVKGPLGVVIPMAVWGMFLLIEQLRQSEGAVFSSAHSTKGAKLLRMVSLFWPPYFLQTVWRMRPLTAILTVLTVAGPWYVWVGLRTDGEFLREFFLVHNVGRASQAMDSHSGPFYYYLLAVCIGTFPWCVLLGPAIANLVRSIRTNAATMTSQTLLACWACVWIGCFSLVSTKLPSYIMPAYPALALIFGSVIDQWLTAADIAVCKRWLRAAWATTAVVGLGIAIAVPVITRIYLSGEWTPALIAIVPLVGTALGLWLSETARPKQSLVTLAVVGICFCTGLLGFSVLPIDRHQNSQSLAEYARQLAPTKPHLASHNYNPPSLVYYAQQPIPRLGNAAEIAKFFADHPEDAFLFTTDKHYEKLAADLPNNIAVVKRDRRFLRNGEVVILGRQDLATARRHESATSHQ